MGRRLRYVLLLLLLHCCGASAGTPDPINPFPQQGSSFFPRLDAFLKNEDANRFGEAFSGFVVSGCLPHTAAGLTDTPTTCTAYPSGYRTTETASVTYQDGSTCWLLVQKDTSGGLTSDVSWQRVAGTHYLTNCSTSAQPVIPDDAIFLAKVVTSGGSITFVDDFRNMSPVPLGITCSGDITQELNDKLGNGIVWIGPGTCDISSEVVTRSRTILRGAGKGATKIRYRGSGAIDMLKFDGPVGSSTTPIAHVGVYDLSMQMTAGNHASTAIHLENAAYFTIDNVIISAAGPNASNCVLIEQTAGFSSVPPVGSGVVREVTCTAGAGSAVAGSHGIYLKGSDSGHVQTVLLDHDEVEDYEHGFRFEKADHNVGIDLWTQGNSTNVSFSVAQLNKIIRVQLRSPFGGLTKQVTFDVDSIRNHLDMPSCFNPTFVDPTDDLGIGNIITNSDGSCVEVGNHLPGRMRVGRGIGAATDVAHGIAEFAKLDADDETIVSIHNGAPPTDKAMLRVERRSDSTKPLTKMTVNGEDAFTVGADESTQVKQLGNFAGIPNLQSGDPPSVTPGNVFRTNNTVTTTINDFTGAIAGQRLTLVCGESNTTIADSTAIQLRGTGNFKCTAIGQPAPELVYDGTDWIEVGATPRRGTATIDFADPGANSCNTSAIVVIGAAVGDVTTLGVPSTALNDAESSFVASVSAADTVTVRHCCIGASGCDPASGIFTAFIWK